MCVVWKLEMQWDYRLIILRKPLFVYHSIKEFERKFYTTSSLSIIFFFDKMLNVKDFLNIIDLCFSVTSLVEFCGHESTGA